MVDSELAALVGPSRVMTDPATCAGAAVDGKVPDCLVAPAKAEQVVALLQYAGEHHLAVIARGNGTKLPTGNPPRRYDMALALRELNRVIHYEPADLTISVEPGMNFGEFQDLVGRNGLWLPLDPRGGRDSTIGGIIAANAAGPLRQGLGGPRDMVLGLKIATTYGKIAKTGGRVVKNVAGYDLGKLLTGSFGTLGVIVEASLKLFPKSPEHATFTMQAGNLDNAKQLRRGILLSPIGARRLVLVDSTALALLGDSSQNQERSGIEMWIEVGGSHRVIERCERELGQIAAAAGAALARRVNAEVAWEHISDLARWLQQKYPAVTVLKAALPVTACEEFLGRAQQQADAERMRVASFAQVGLGIIHSCVLQETLSSGLVGVVDRLRQVTVDLGGRLIVEHCPVDLKSGVDVWGAGGDDLAAMRKMKSAWDPKEVLAPGRFLGF